MRRFLRVVRQIYRNNRYPEVGGVAGIFLLNGHESLESFL